MDSAFDLVTTLLERRLAGDIEPMNAYEARAVGIVCERVRGNRNAVLSEWTMRLLSLDEEQADAVRSEFWRGRLWM